MVWQKAIQSEDSNWEPTAVSNGDVALVAWANVADDTSSRHPQMAVISLDAGGVQRAQNNDGGVSTETEPLHFRIEALRAVTNVLRTVLLGCLALGLESCASSRLHAVDRDAPECDLRMVCICGQVRSATGGPLRAKVLAYAREEWRPGLDINGRAVPPLAHPGRILDDAGGSRTETDDAGRFCVGVARTTDVLIQVTALRFKHVVAWMPGNNQELDVTLVPE